MRPGFFYYRRRLDRRVLMRALALLLAVSLTILFLSLREEEKLPAGRNFKTTASTGDSAPSGK